ncbi:MAG: hypothetical protein ACR2IE_19625 [Candidatus Sumerlaeaceae bacterium]
MKVEQLPAWVSRFLLPVGALLALLTALVVFGMNRTGYTPLPDGSRIKLLAVTTGKEHRVCWKYFSLSNTVRKYSREFGPYIAGEITDVNTTSSVDCVVFWTRRVFGKTNVRPLSAMVTDEKGSRDRIAQGPYASSVLRDRFNPTSDGVVQGWAIPRSMFLGKTLRLHLFERPESSIGTADELVSYSAPNPLAVQPEPEFSSDSRQAIGRYNVSIVGFTSGVPYGPPAFFDSFFRPTAGGREFLGTSVTLRVQGQGAETHCLVARHLQARSAGGISVNTYNLRQTTAPGQLQIAFSPSCNSDLWNLEVELTDDADPLTRSNVIDGILTEDANNAVGAVDSDPWSYAMHTFTDFHGDNRVIQVRCGPISDEGLFFSISSADDPRKPIYATSLLDENGRRVPFQQDDVFSLRGRLKQHAKLKLEMSERPTTGAVFWARPEILLPELKQSPNRGPT